MDRNMHKLVDEYVKANQKRYGRSTGNAMALGALMAHVGFFLNGEDPAYSLETIEERVETLLMEIVAGEGVEE